MAAALAVSSLAIYSCNNGAYDIDPKNNPGALNPLDTTSGVTIPLGSLKLTVNDVPYFYYPAKYKEFKIDGAGTVYQYFQTTLDNDPIFRRLIQFRLHDIKNLQEFAYEFAYIIKDTTLDTPAIYRPTDDFKFTIKGNESGNYRGVFSGKLKLDRTAAVPYGVVDELKVTNGEYYIPMNTDFKIIGLESSLPGYYK